MFKRTARLADLQVPQPLSLWVALGLLNGRRQNRRAQREMENVFSNLATFFGDRLAEQDRRETEMLKLTRRVVQLTWVVVSLTVAATAFAGWALYRS